MSLAGWNNFTALMKWFDSLILSIFKFPTTLRRGSSSRTSSTAPQTPLEVVWRGGCSQSPTSTLTSAGCHSARRNSGGFFRRSLIKGRIVCVILHPGPHLAQNDFTQPIYTVCPIGSCTCFDMGITPCLAAWHHLPNFRQPRQNWAESLTIKTLLNPTQIHE